MVMLLDDTPTVAMVPDPPRGSFRTKFPDSKYQSGLGQFERATFSCRRGGWRNHRPDITVWCLVQVDDHRCVIARQRAFTSLTVDPGGAHSTGHRVAGQHQVDSHAQVLLKHA